MSYKFNPFTGNLDEVSGVTFWKDPVDSVGDLPALNNAIGDARAVKDTGAIYVWDGSMWISSSGISGIGSAVLGSTPYSILSVDGSGDMDEIGPLTDGQLIIGDTAGAAVAASLTGTANQVTVTPGAGSITLSLPQDINTTADVEFNSATLNAIDTEVTGGTDTLTIGIANADVINIGRSGAIINIQGTTFYQDVTNLQVADKLFTVNVGGSAGSAADSGFEIEENALITGYVKTSPDRNSFLLKAPNTAGDVTLTPGASGIVINQSSHDSVTIGTFGAVPNANGLSISGQVLTLQPANATNPGAVTTAAQTFAGVKTFSSVPIAGGMTSTAGLTFATAVGGSIALNAGGSGGNVSANTAFFTGVQSATPGAQLESQAATEQLRLRFNATTRATFFVTTNGVFTLTAVGTAPSITLTGGTTTVDNLIDSGLTANTVPYANGSKQLTSSAVTPTELGYVSGVTSAIQAQIDAKASIVTGDIPQTSFTAADNQVAAADVTGLTFANASVRSFQAMVSIVRDTTYSQYILNGIQKGASWEMTQSYAGDVTGLTFSITAAGAVQYTSTSTGNTAALKFRAQVTSV